MRTPRKSALWQVARIVVAGFLSLLCAAWLSGQGSFADPGTLAVHRFLSLDAHGHRDLGVVLIVAIGVNFVVCFAIWYGVMSLVRHLVEKGSA